MADDNVFAAGGDHGSGRGGTRDVTAYEWTDRGFGDVMGLLQRGWDLVLANLGTVGLAIAILFGVAVVGQVINTAVAFGAEMIDDPGLKLGVQLIGQQGLGLLFTAVNLFLQLGLMKLVIEIDRGNDAEFDVLWSQGSALVQAIAVSIVLFLVYIVAISLGIAVLGGGGFALFTALGPENGMMAAVGLIAVLSIPIMVLAIYIGLGLSMMFYSLVDGRAEWVGAIPFSWELTTGWKLFLFLQGIVLFLITLLVACFTLCMGLAVAGGVLSCVQAVTYNAILSDADASGRLA